MPAQALLPGYLAERFASWKALRFEPDRAWYARLAEGGQHPRAMLLSCCDSRVDAVGMFGAEPGDLFVVRNVANLVPPYRPDHQHHGTSAAIEYAVTVLKVAHVVVMGHSHCGGVAACHDMCAGLAPELDKPGSFVGRWMDILRPAYEAVADRLPEDREERLRAFERHAVLASVRNLAQFPFVADAVARGVLTLHGAWIDIGAGELHGLDLNSETWRPVV
ncbi:carbonic anhydrase [Oceanicella actignis]|uniref:Carbonic anhydrase n=1 Tax=Oceanicella actignis TaxID=1189325 RepID=A0A1M7T498_9RHOB|nr:carbonic anhydrase [Oceanicella actignis]SET41445.1 carbonic anhydrase [Oceanicella actignis]SHN65580.1 carbonic anhydrase [Oceanicella actignis]